MKIQLYLDKLSSSETYKQFREKYTDSFLIAGFFVLDYESGQNIHQLDYYIPSSKKVAAFNFGEKIDLKLLELMNKKIPEKLDIHTKVDLDELKGIIEDGMKNRSLSEEVKKIIAIIQTVEGKKFWNINCVLSGMEILKVDIEDESKTILRMEKSSILDYVKKIPGAQLSAGKPSKESIDKQIHQLDKLKEELQKEKEELEKKEAEKPETSTENPEDKLEKKDTI